MSSDFRSQVFNEAVLFCTWIKQTNSLTQIEKLVEF